MLHENSHYVGGDTRKRGERTRHLLRAISMILGQMLLETFYREGECGKYSKIRLAAKKFISLQIDSLFKKELEMINNLVDKDQKDDLLHSIEIKSYINKRLPTIYRELESSLVGILSLEIPVAQNERQTANREEVWRELNAIRTRVITKLSELGYKGELSVVLHELISDFCEIHSDLVMLHTLNIETKLEYYLEALQIQEGLLMTQKEWFSLREKNRRAVVIAVVCEENENARIEWESYCNAPCDNERERAYYCVKMMAKWIQEWIALHKNTENGAGNVIDGDKSGQGGRGSRNDALIKNIYYNEGTWEEMFEYGRLVYGLIKSKLEFPGTDKKEKLGRIREIFRCFENYEQGKDQFYEFIPLYEQITGD